MRSIRIKDLEVVEQERFEKEIANKSMAQIIAMLTVENKKKDMLIEQLSQTVAALNIEIAKLKGGNN